MKAMKTVEEMRDDVLAECETLCPQSTKGFWHSVNASIKLMHHPSEVHRWSLDFFDGDGTNEWLCVLCWIGEDMNAEEADTAYRLLGLSERDAVEAERAEMMKTVDALSAMVSVDPVSFAELEAKNAALVAAINEAIHHGGYFYANGHGEHHGNGGEKVLNVVGKILTAAIEANEKGGANG